MPIRLVVCINVLDVFVSYTDRGFTVDRYSESLVLDIGLLNYFFLNFIRDCIQGGSITGVFKSKVPRLIFVAKNSMA